MQKNREWSAATRFLLAFAAFVIVVAGMKVAVPMLVPFLLSVFITIVAAPALFWLRRRRVPTAAAMLIVGGAIVVAGLLVAVIVGQSITDFTRELPEYQTRLQEKTGGLFDWLETQGIDLSEDVVQKSINPGAVMQLVAKMLNGLGGMLTNRFLILLTVIFMLLEASGFRAKLGVALNRPSSIEELQSIADNINRYMALKTLVSVATGITIGVWLAIIGIDYPILWGLLAFLLNYVPNIGSIIAAIPAVLLAFIQYGTGHALAAAGGFLVVNIVVGSVVEPRVMGRGLGLSTLVVFLSLVFWGWVLGPVGMLLSVPLTMTLKIALEGNEDTRWIGILLGSERAALDMANEKEPDS